MDSSNKRILLLGSGMMSRSIIEYFLRFPTNVITIGTRNQEVGEAIIKEFNSERLSLAIVDVKDEETLRTQIRNHDIVCNMAPALYQVAVAKICLAEKKNVVTTDYTNPELQQYAQEFKENNLVCLNETGIHPGMDHLAAMKIIDEVKAQNGKVLSYESLCGGLVAPDCCDNPYGYKFSWWPLGSLRSLQLPARYLEDGDIVEPAGEDLMYLATDVEINPAITLEFIANRDCVKYRDVYNIPEVQTIKRGRMRYQGFSLIMRSLSQLGFLAEKPLPQELREAKNWRQLLNNIVASQNSDSCSRLPQEAILRAIKPTSLTQDDVRFATQIANSLVNVSHYERLSETVLESYLTRVFKTFDWTGMFSTETPVGKGETYIEILSSLLETKLMLKEGERDFIVFLHRYRVEIDGKQQNISQTMLLLGDQDTTAMARSVGKNVAIATQLILDGKISDRGLLVPTSREFYEPMLQALEKEGVKMLTQRY